MAEKTLRLRHPWNLRHRWFRFKLVHPWARSRASRQRSRAAQVRLTVAKEYALFHEVPLSRALDDLYGGES